MASPLRRCYGTLKQFYEDFTVREIDELNQPVTLVQRESIAELVKQFCGTDQKSCPSSSTSTYSRPTYLTDASNIQECIDLDTLKKLDSMSRWVVCPEAPESTVEVTLHGATGKNSSILVQLRLAYPTLSIQSTPSSTKVTVIRDKRFLELIKIPALSREDIENLYIFRNGHQIDPDAKAYIDIGNGLNKSDRTALFRAISTADKSLQLRTLSIERGDECKKIIRVTKCVNRKRKILASESTDEFPIYAHFTLYKRGIESFNVIEKVAKCLSIGQSELIIAGMKDRHAVTYQRICFRASGWSQQNIVIRCQRLTDMFPISEIGKADCYMAVGAWKFSTRPLSLGQLGGNLFSVRIRNFSADGIGTTSDIMPLLKERESLIRSMGFPNFFGTQRTGNMREMLCRGTALQRNSKLEIPCGPKVGKYLILGLYQEAVRCILCEDCTFDENVECKGNRNSTSHLIKKARAYYMSNPADVEKALHLFPISCVRERTVLNGLIRYGYDNYKACIESIPYRWRIMYVNAYQSYIFNIVTSYRLALSQTKILIGDLVKTSGSSIVRVITKEDIDSREIQMKDIVIPMFGKNAIVYPDNDSGYFYSAVLKREGILDATCSSDNFAFKISGTYRPIIQVAHDLTTTCISSDSQYRTVQEMRNKDESTSLDVTLNFRLPAGSYATSMISHFMANPTLL